MSGVSLLHCSIEGRWCHSVCESNGENICTFVGKKIRANNTNLHPTPHLQPPVVRFPPQPQPPPHLLCAITTRVSTLALPPSTNAGAAVQCVAIQLRKSNTTTRSKLFQSNLCFQARMIPPPPPCPPPPPPLPPPRGSHRVFVALTPPHVLTRSADATRCSSSRLLARRTRRSHRFQKNWFFLVRSPCGGERPRRLHSRQNALHTARLLSPMASTASIAGARVGCAWARRRVLLHQHHRHGRVTRRVWRAARPRCIALLCAVTLLHHTANKRVARNVWHAT
jgi:hypothetical protein